MSSLSLQRNSSLDALKGFCIVLMVIGHSGCPDWLYRVIYTFHMPCFFIISGMLFKQKYVESTGLFIKRKIKGLWWPFVKWNLFFLVIHNLLVSWHLESTPFTLRYSAIKACHVLVMHGSDYFVSGFWFIYVLFLASIISVLYFKYVGFTSSKLLSGILLLCALGMLFAHFWTGGQYMLHAVCEGTAYFFVGVMITRIGMPQGARFATLTLLAAIMVFVTAFLLPYTDVKANVTAANMLPYFMSACLISYFLIGLFAKLREGRLTRRLAWIGEKTLDILIWHYLGFKLVSYCIVVTHGLDMSRMTEFQVIREYALYWWPIYAVVGISFSLTAGAVVKWLGSTISAQLNTLTATIRGIRME